MSMLSMALEDLAYDLIDGLRDYGPPKMKTVRLTRGPEQPAHDVMNPCMDTCITIFYPDDTSQAFLIRVSALSERS